MIGIVIVTLVWVASGLLTALMLARAGHRDAARPGVCIAVDLISVGRRVSGMSVRLLGTVAEAILHEAELPVLVGPRVKEPDGRGSTRITTARKVR